MKFIFYEWFKKGQCANAGKMDGYKNKNIFRNIKNSNLYPLPEEDSTEGKYLTRKKFLGEKTMIKNFFKHKSGVGHYHFGAKAQTEMIVYTFLLPGKNDFSREGLRIFCEISNNIF